MIFENKENDWLANELKREGYINNSSTLKEFHSENEHVDLKENDEKWRKNKKKENEELDIFLKNRRRIFEKKKKWEVLTIVILIFAVIFLLIQFLLIIFHV